MKSSDWAPGAAAAGSTISDILVNGHNLGVHRAGGNVGRDQHQVQGQCTPDAIIDKIVSDIGRHVDESSPMVDARLADGSRVNVIIPRWQWMVHIFRSAVLATFRFPIGSAR